jgi:alkanesulfonate monooxygenase SsuD/methylene tetrahydromethanopterin reductase-like flavin-dependent oxidoreductase (luciferase family)
VTESLVELNSEKLGFALRPSVFSAPEIEDASGLLDREGRVVAVFIPDGRGGLEAIEVASIILAVTKRIYAGSGVIRLLEHDLTLLLRRVQTIQAFSSNRLILGVGTGTPGPRPRSSVTAMLQRLEELKKTFHVFPLGVEPPELYVATLKSGIARRSVGVADGLLLNFCSPQHARGLIETVKRQMAAPVEFAAYLKIFYSSKSDETARRLLVQEFLNYDTTGPYHEMFMQDGTAGAISEFRNSDDWKHNPVPVPKELLRVSLANPSDDELHRYVQSFRQAGVTLPVPYPYFPADESTEFKRDTVKRILELA